MESEMIEPKTYTIEKPIYDENGESRVQLNIVEYDNAIQASLYDKSPRLGSMTLAYPVMERIERHSIFTGKHDQLSAALAMIMVRATKKIVYASVNIKEHTSVSNELIKEMITEYTDKITKE